MSVDHLCELAMVDFQAGRLREAEARCRGAIMIGPKHTGALHLLGLCLQSQNRLEEAEELLNQCVLLEPDAVEHRNNWGVLLGRLGRYAESERELRRVIELSPNYAPAHRNLGITRVRQGDVSGALVALRRALELAPNDAAAHNTLGRALLYSGDFEAGWAEGEWRFRQEKPWWSTIAAPVWDGNTPLVGKTILLHAEQGLGDTLQFSRYVRLLSDSGAVVLLLAQPPICSLIRSLDGVEGVFPVGAAVDRHFDFHAPLMSLPFLLRTRLETIPKRVPYLDVNPDRIRYWNQQLQNLTSRLKIGISWQGSTSYYSDRHRSIPLSAFEPLARLDGVQLISLQKRYGSEQLNSFAGRDAVLDLGLDPGGEAFLDAAAVMQSLDLVITSDTAIAHLAGALGVPVWVALCAAPDWRWLAERSDSPWYPTMRLFRQKTLGDWSTVFEEIAATLGKSLPHEGAVDSGHSPQSESAAAAAGATIRIGPGELIDRLGILRLKASRIDDSSKRARAAEELSGLENIAQNAIPASEWIKTLSASLMAINDRLWQVEDELRACEAIGEYGENFVELARSVCRLNDRRSSLKGKIDRALGWSFVETKVYVPANPRRSARTAQAANAAPASVQGAIKALRAQNLPTAKRLAGEVLEREPDNAQAMHVLGLVAYEQEELEPALEWMRRSIAKAPDVPAFHNNLGEALRKAGRLEDSVRSYCDALRLKEDYSDAHYNLGISYRFLGKAQEALDHNQRAALLSPDDPEIHLNLSITHFLTGNWLEGFREYEWRWKAASFGASKRTFPMPRWKGEDLKDKTILVHAEQGFGDTLQFCRYVPLLVERGAVVTVEVQPEVKELLACLAAKIRSRGESLGEFDYHCPMLSLPLEFGTTMDTVPKHVPYLEANRQKIAQWAIRLRHEGIGGKRIGLVWAGRHTHKNDKQRSIALKQFIPLASVSKTRLISLQQGEAARQADGFSDRSRDGLGVEQYGPFTDFADTAALLMNLDLLITVDTAVAHLGGALGKPVWMLNPFVCDWRWMLEGEDTPWYPTMRIFRQPQNGDWSSTIECVANALRKQT